MKQLTAASVSKADKRRLLVALFKEVKAVGCDADDCWQRRMTYMQLSILSIDKKN